MKDFAAKLKNQYSRCVAMFERAMEEEDPYSYGELRDLCVNPVTAGILNRLVFIGKGAAEQYDTAAEQEKAADGQILLGTLEELRGAGTEPAADTQLLVAHPITLYRAGRLPEYQRMFFEKQKESGTRQPFKQVFREFYVKLEEEKDAKDSRMFAGYQIQPKKTVAALRGRRWVADYDEGLQKVFFKQNISATIYALADWFSPADTECPTLEYVSFYDRKTYRQKNLSEIPDTHPIEEEPGGKQQKEHKEPLIKEIVDDRDEEKRLESADDPSPHIRRACAVVGTVRSQHIFCSRPDIRLLPAFRFLCVFSTVSPLAASDYTFPEQYLRLLPFPCDLLHTLFLRIRFNGMIFQTSLYAVFTKHHGPR